MIFCDIYLGAHWFVIIRFAEEDPGLQRETHTHTQTREMLLCYTLYDQQYVRR